MPFTFSHVAAVLPLLRGRPSRWSATGLIIGSIVPDFEKFLRLSAHNGHSHSWASLFYFSCPMAVGLAFLFHGVVRNPLLAHLPTGLHRRLARFGRFQWPPYFRRHYGRVLASVLLGASTHLVWDSFTHRTGELVALWPFLKTPWHVGTLWAPVFVVANLLSSVAGLWLVLRALWRLPLAPSLPAGTPAPAPARTRYWRLVGVVALALVGARLLVPGPLKDIDVIISALSGSMIGVGVASAYWSPGRTGRRMPGA